MILRAILPNILPAILTLHYRRGGVYGVAGAFSTLCFYRVRIVRIVAVLAKNSVPGRNNTVGSRYSLALLQYTRYAIMLINCCWLIMPHVNAYQVCYASERASSRQADTSPWLAHTGNDQGCHR